MELTVDFSPIAEDSPHDPAPASCNAVREENTAAAYDGIEAQPQIEELLQNSDFTALLDKFIERIDLILEKSANGEPLLQPTGLKSNQCRPASLSINPR